MKNVCKRCGSDNVIYKRCINCGESYPYTDLSISKGSNIILFGLPVAAVLFVAVKNSFGNQDGSQNHVLSALGDQTSSFEQQKNESSVFKSSKMNLPPEDYDPLNTPF